MGTKANRTIVISPKRRLRLFAILWLLWAAALLGSYYKQVALLGVGEPSGWNLLAADVASSKLRVAFFGILLTLLIVWGLAVRIPPRLHWRSGNSRGRLTYKVGSVVGAVG